MANVVDLPIITTSYNSTATEKNDVQAIKGAICIAACFGMLSPTLSSMPPEPMKSNTPNITLTNVSKPLVYDNGDFTIVYTSMGEFLLDEQIRENVNTLFEFLRLEENWNGNGAVPFSEDFIFTCCDIVKKLVYQPEIFPTAQRSIQFEWDNSSGDYLEIQLFENGSCKMASRKRTGEWVKKSIELDAIGECVEEFFARSNC